LELSGLKGPVAARRRLRHTGDRAFHIVCRLQQVTGELGRATLHRLRTTPLGCAPDGY
jgi:hypothetical protein